MTIIIVTCYSLLGDCSPSLCAALLYGNTSDKQKLQRQRNAILKHCRERQFVSSNAFAFNRQKQLNHPELKPRAAASFTRPSKVTSGNLDLFKKHAVHYYSACSNKYALTGPFVLPSNNSRGGYSGENN